MPDDVDAIFQAWDQGKPRPRVVVDNTPKGGAQKEEADRAEGPRLSPARLPDPGQICPRQWLYGTQLVRGFVTVLVAPGGTGKSSYAMAVGLSCASEMTFLGARLFECVNVAIFNLEDPLEELDRRVAALMLRHRIPRQALENRLFLNDAEGHKLCIAAVGPDPSDPNISTIVYPDRDALIKEIRAHEIGLVICDPFVESHELEENSNPHMAKAAAAWRDIARATNCAVLLVHHVRKGEITSIDAARGAKALTDSARVGLLFSPMTPEEGAEFNVRDEDRWQYVRLDDAKRNMAPAAKASWFKLEQVPLGNGGVDPRYPNGDTVAAIAAWDAPRDELKTAPHKELNEALDEIAQGPGNGVLYKASKQGGGHWCGIVLCRRFGSTERQARRMINQWLQTGLLYEDTYHDPLQRKPRPCVRVDSTKRPS